MSFDLAIPVSQFRANFPAFADSSVYLDENIDIWLQFATQMLNAARWGRILPLGLSLFVAHQLSMDRQAQIIANRGGVPGFGYGVMNSKSINGVSVSYDTNIAALKDAGDYGLTIYGIRFLGLARMVGSGGVQIIGNDAIMSGLFTSFNGQFPNF